MDPVSAILPVQKTDEIMKQTTKMKILLLVIMLIYFVYRYDNLYVVKWTDIAFFILVVCLVILIAWKENDLL